MCQVRGTSARTGEVKKVIEYQLSLTMDDHSDTQHHEHSPFPSVPTSMTSAATRAIIRVLERRGYDTTPIRKWPEFVTDKVMDAIERIADKQKQGQPITPADRDDLEQAINENPAAAPVLMTAATSHLASSTGPQSESEEILESYAYVLNAACEYMSKAGTSIALRGFIHDGNCISYWEKAPDGKPEFQLSGRQLIPNNLDVYLIERTPEEQQLSDLNTTIRRDPKRKLSQGEIDYQNRESVKKLIAVEDVRLQVHGLPSAKRPNPFKTRPMPETLNILIPPGAPALIGMFESLFEAQEVQGVYVTGSRETRQVIETALKAAKTP